MQEQQEICKELLHIGVCNKQAPCPFSHDLRKVKRCPYYLNCPKYLDCDYSHEPIGILIDMFRNKLCELFQKDRCARENCKFEHRYIICGDYDNGFCPKGSKCQKKHVLRKICDNYLHGFCPLGPECKMVHVKIFEKNDSTGELDFTKTLYRFMSDQGIIPKEYPEFRKVICNTCHQVGHKSNACKYDDKMNIWSPTRVILCGKCGKEHSIIQQAKNCVADKLQDQ